MAERLRLPLAGHATPERCRALLWALAALAAIAVSSLTWPAPRCTAAPRHASLSSGGGGGAGQFPSATDLLKAFVQAPLPPIAPNISKDAPLLFLHQRKAGGTSMRAVLATAAAAANISSYVPCFDGVDCDTYVIGAKRVAVYAGHFPWGAQQDLTRRATYNPSARGGGWHYPQQRLSCLTMFRDPVARLQSCYQVRFQQRLRKQHGNKYACLSDLPAEELRRIFLTGRSVYGRGCLNEPFRMLSGWTDEDRLAQLAQLPASAPAFLAVLEATLANLAKCVPLVLEDARSQRLPRHWFPQLAAAFEEQLPRKHAGGPRCALSDGARAVLEELSSGERMLYKAVQRRIDVMLRSVNAT